MLDARPLFNVSLADDIDNLKSKVLSLQSERDTLMEINTKLQAAAALKDNVIIKKNQELADLQSKYIALKQVVQLNNTGNNF